MSLYSERRREIETILGFTAGIVLISLGSFLWLFSPMSDQAKSWGQGMYWFGFAALTDGVFLVAKHIKLVVTEFAALGAIFSVLGLYWSDAYQTDVYNPLTLAALGIFFATGLMIIELWNKERQADS